MNKIKIKDMKISNIKQIKTTIIGTLLIILSCADLWYFESMTTVIGGIPIQVIGIIFGAGLWLFPDSIISFGRNKLKQ